MEETSAETAWRDATMGSHKGDWEWIAREMHRAFGEDVARGQSEAAWCQLEGQLSAIEDDYWALSGSYEDLQDDLSAAYADIASLRERLNAKEN